MKEDFRCKLELTLRDITISKEESVTIKIIKAFSNEKILLQHPVLNYQIDLNFPEHKLAIEIDEKGHTDRDEKKKKMKEKKKEKNNLHVNLLELILMQKIMIFVLRLVKYMLTLLNQM